MSQKDNKHLEVCVCMAGTIQRATNPNPSTDAMFMKCNKLFCFLMWWGWAEAEVKQKCWWPLNQYLQVNIAQFADHKIKQACVCLRHSPLLFPGQRGSVLGRGQFQQKWHLPIQTLFLDPIPLPRSIWTCISNFTAADPNRPAQRGVKLGKELADQRWIRHRKNPLPFSCCGTWHGSLQFCAIYEADLSTSIGTTGILHRVKETNDSLLQEMQAKVATISVPLKCIG